MINDIFDALGHVKYAIDHALNHKQRARDKETRNADLLLRREAWDRYIAAGGEDVVKYTRPSIENGDSALSTTNENRFDVARAAFVNPDPHVNKNFFNGDSKTGYKVDATSVAQHNKNLRARMRAEKRSLQALAERADEERNHQRQLADVERRCREDLEASLECDSPAETDFLREIIATHKMSFSEGAFRGDGVIVKRQVEIGRYRVDFLFNDKLIVEIDGHEFHSGRDNANRDARRDATLRAKGYKLLRIPAYRVYHNPGAAASDVMDFLHVLASKI